MTHATDPRTTDRGAVETWRGHPRGLSTLFFTEMWERFSYYGMRALLVLFMTAAVGAANPGLGLDDATATAVYGLYTAMVYLLALPGGWVADKLWGQQRAVLVGGIIIAAGHFTLAGPLVGLPEKPTFFLGLLLVVLGTGLLKPNVSTIVGQLYDRLGDGDTAQRVARRDAGFSLFYTGINLGAIIGPFLCGLAGEKVSYHWGFSLAGFGMLAGVLQYRRGVRLLGDAGAAPQDEPTPARRRGALVALLVSALVVAALGWGLANGALGVDLTTFTTWVGYAIVLLTVAYFGYLLLFAGYGAQDRRRLGVILWLFLLAAAFWAGFEQAGSSLNLFAERLTDRTVGGFEMPTSWLQNVNPIFIIVFAPLFGVVWTRLAARRRNPSLPVKFALGLLFVSAGFLVVSWGAANASDAHKVTPVWLVVTYFLHTAGELCLSPIGLSSMSRLAPRDRVGQMMGVWFVAAALGNLVAGLLAGGLDSKPPTDLFRVVAIGAGAAGIIALLASPLVRRLGGSALDDDGEADPDRDVIHARTDEPVGTRSSTRQARSPAGLSRTTPRSPPPLALPCFTR